MIYIYTYIYIYIYDIYIISISIIYIYIYDTNSYASGGCHPHPKVIIRLSKKLLFLLYKQAEAKCNNHHSF